MKHKYERVGYYKKSTFLPQYVEGAGEGKKRRWGQGYFRLAIGGRLNFFIKKFREVSKLMAKYILTGVHWPNK